MDPDLLRLILVALGVTLVIGIYLFDKFKRARAERADYEYAEDEGQQRREPEMGLMDNTAWDTSDIIDDRGPSIADHAEDQAEPEDRPNIIEKAVSRREIETKQRPEEQLDVDPEPLELSEWDTIDSDVEVDPQYSMDLSFNAQGDSDHVSLDPDLINEIPRKIIQINIVARGEPFPGPLLFKAAKEVDLEFGDMNIFHRTDLKYGRQVLFSMANLVEPGNFPEGAKERQVFSSPGVTIFTQLPAVRDGLAVYSDMLFTAERMAAILGAELEDEYHSALTKQTIEHTREGILEHKRQIQIIRNRRRI